MTDPIHDFAAKLRQPSLLPAVESYVRWRRALARARAEGREDPPPPERAPISINLDLTTACNYRCDHCIDWEVLNTRHRHREEALRGAIDGMCARGLRSVILIGGGEPTLYPGFPDFVRFLKGRSLQVAIVSNGSRGESLWEVADALSEHDWVRLSLDAGTNELFRAMHRPARAALSLDEICGWVPRIKERNPGLRVGYSFIIVWRGATRDGVPLRENVHEIALAAERARASGFDYVAFKPVLERADDGAEVMDPARTARDRDPARAEQELAAVLSRIRAEIERARRYEDGRFRVHVSTNLRVLFQGNWRDLTRQPRTCHVQALRQVLTPLGTFNCPAHRGVARARVGDAALHANAARAGLETARILEGFDASRECGDVTCLYNGTNWWLEKLVSEPGSAPDTVDLSHGEEREDHFL